MKKIIENTMVSLNNPLRAVRLLIVLLGVIGVLLSCGSAEESGGGGGGVSASPNFSAADVSVTFGIETGSVEIDTTNPSSPTLVISGLTNADDTTTVGGTLRIVERPDEFTTSTTSLIFADPAGVRAIDTNLSDIISISNLSSDEVITYAVRIEFTGKAVTNLVTTDSFIATLGSQTGVVIIGETTLTIEFLNLVGTNSGTLMIDSLPIGYVASPMPYTFMDPPGVSRSNTTADPLTISEVDGRGNIVNNNTVTYAVNISYLEARSPLLPQDITATFGDARADVSDIRISGTTITITGFRNYDDSLVDATSALLEFKLGITGRANTFTASHSGGQMVNIDGTNIPGTSIINERGTSLAGTSLATPDLGTFIILRDYSLSGDYNNEMTTYTVSVEFAPPLQLQVSGDIVLPSGETYRTILEGELTGAITANLCSEVLPTFVVATDGAAATGYTVGDIDAGLPYVLNRNIPTNIKAVMLNVLMGSEVVGVFSFDYKVSCTASVLTGNGSDTNAYQISSASELDLVAHLVDINANYGSAHYRVTTDLDLGVVGAPWAETSGEPGFNPIGEESYPFGGNFDCNDNTISGLFIGRGTENNIGLISTLGSAGSVSNCHLENIKVVGNNNVGGLVGKDGGGSISANTVSGEVTGFTLVGGLVGAANGTISDSSVSGVVTGTSSTVGGLVGISADGTISNSYATGAVTGANGSVGGLAGVVDATTISSSYATAAVEGSSNVGGLVGISSGNITNSYAIGEVEGSSNVGGLVGDFDNGIISNSYATGGVTGTGTSINVGGLVGLAKARATISNSYATGGVTGTGTSINVGGLVGSASGTISSSMATGAVTGSNYVGGLIGQVGGGSIFNVYSRGAVSISSSSTETSSGGLMGGVSGNGTITIVNSYTVSTGAHRSFVGEILTGATLTVMNSYAQRGIDLGFTPTLGDSSTEESRDALKMPTDKGTSAMALYFDWDTDIWDFGEVTELPILSGLPAEFVQARD